MIIQESIVSIPVLQVINAITFVIVAFLTYRAWGSATFSAFKAFVHAMLFAALAFGALSLRGMLVHDPMFMQYTINLGYFFYGIMTSLFLRAMFLFTTPKRVSLTVILPVVFMVLSLGLLVAHSMNSYPIEEEILFMVGGVELLEHANTGDTIISVLYGAQGMVVFLVATIMFMSQLVWLEDPLQYKRSLYFSLGSLFASIAVMFSFVVISVTGFTYLILLGSGAAFISAVMLYMATRVAIRE